MITFYLLKSIDKIANNQSKTIASLENMTDPNITMLMLAHRAKDSLFSWMLLFAQEAEQVQKYWHSVLKRLISITKVSCERGLAFRGEDRQ